MRMKKMLLAGLVVTLITAGTLFAEAPQDQEGSRERLRNALRIRQEMREIEKTAIDNDAELKAITEDIKKMHQKMQVIFIGRLVFILLMIKKRLISKINTQKTMLNS